MNTRLRGSWLRDTRLRRTTLVAAVAAGLVSAAPPAAASGRFGPARLIQFAELPAQTFVPGSEPSGGCSARRRSTA